MHARSVILLAVSTLAISCAARHIEGTEIPDTSDTRAIITVMERYNRALEAKDAQAILSLVSLAYKDDAGTATPADDLDYATLQKVLPERLAQLQDVQVNISVREIDVERDEAAAIFYYTSSYRIPSLTNQARTDSDLNRMGLRREDGEWRIVSGL